MIISVAVLQCFLVYAAFRTTQKCLLIYKMIIYVFFLYHCMHIPDCYIYFNEPKNQLILYLILFDSKKLDSKKKNFQSTEASSSVQREYFPAGIYFSIPYNRFSKTNHFLGSKSRGYREIPRPFTNKKET